MEPLGVFKEVTKSCTNKDHYQSVSLSASPLMHVQALACEAIFSVDDPDRAQIASAGGIEAAVPAMGAHRGSVQVVGPACWVLLSLADLETRYDTEHNRVRIVSEAVVVEGALAHVRVKERVSGNAAAL